MAACTLLIVNGLPSTSVSLPNNVALLIVNVVSSAAAITSSIATGASFCGLTVIVVVAVGEVVPPSSVMLKAILAVPLKFGAGVKIKPAAWAGVNAEFATTGVTPSAKYSTPCVANGSAVTVMEAIVPSISLPLKLMAILLSSLPIGVVGLAVGASLMAVTGPRLSAPVSVNTPSDMV